VRIPVQLMRLQNASDAAHGCVLRAMSMLSPLGLFGRFSLLSQLIPLAG